MTNIGLLDIKLAADITRARMLNIAAFTVTRFNGDGKSAKSTQTFVNLVSKTFNVLLLEPNAFPLPTKKASRSAVNAAHQLSLCVEQPGRGLCALKRLNS
ncbi:hypothetical protein V7S43_009715 [Phytophthora oleae]|uniref:Uncharacterized protein n=1 Tax=Phytophthora oleae TaxID=2107226 RepID=A0ABD3FFA9_9STRA